MRGWVTISEIQADFSATKALQDGAGVKFEPKLEDYNNATNNSSKVLDRVCSRWSLARPVPQAVDVHRVSVWMYIARDKGTKGHVIDTSQPVDLLLGHGKAQSEPQSARRLIPTYLPNTGGINAPCVRFWHHFIVRSKPPSARPSNPRIPLSPATLGGLVLSDI